MTTTTRTGLVCECGHTGQEVFKENDQPYSGLWEKYSLSGFIGNEIVITSASSMPEDILATLNPRCPSCGETGKVRYG